MERREIFDAVCHNCGKTNVCRIIQSAGSDSEMLFISIESKCEECGYEWGFAKWRTNIELKEEKSDS